MINLGNSQKLTIVHNQDMYVAMYKNSVKNGRYFKIIFVIYKKLPAYFHWEHNQYHWSETTLSLEIHCFVLVQPEQVEQIQMEN